MMRGNTNQVVCDCPAPHKHLVHRDTRRRHRLKHNMPNIPASPPANEPVESFMTFCSMDIDDNASHESEGLQQHDPDEAESSVNMDELDCPPVLIESDDERDDIESTEEGDGEDDEEEDERQRHGQRLG